MKMYKSKKEIVREIVESFLFFQLIAFVLFTIIFVTLAFIMWSFPDEINWGLVRVFSTAGFFLWLWFAFDKDGLNLMNMKIEKKNES